MNKEQIVRDFIRMKKGQEVDGYEVVNMMRDEWGLSFDHHIASAVLDSMETVQEVVFVGFNRSRVTRYIVN